MVFAFYQRLNAKQRHIYRASDQKQLSLPPEVNLAHELCLLERELKQEQRLAVQQVCQRIIDTLLAAFKLPPVRVLVFAKRPSNHAGELHGLYEGEEGGQLAKVSIWMRTAQRQQIVAYKTFLRTLLHEFCHHVDFELFKFPESFHTEGFYKRESTLLNRLLAQVMRENEESCPSK